MANVVLNSERTETYNLNLFNGCWEESIELSTIIDRIEAVAIYAEIRALVVNSGACSSNQEFNTWVIEDLQQEQFQNDLQYQRIPLYIHFLRGACTYLAQVKQDYIIKVTEDYLERWG